MGLCRGRLGHVRQRHAEAMSEEVAVGHELAARSRAFLLSGSYSRRPAVAYMTPLAACLRG
jgi:hypothetical protein